MPTETETLLVCEGERKSFIQGTSENIRETFIITKLGGKVTKVKTENDTFTLDKVRDSVKEGKVTTKQLIVESDRLIFRYEGIEGNKISNADAILFNTGKYTMDRGVFMKVESMCTVGKKAF
ncbi:MAG: hypothetical protein IPH15_13000 [Comamonadaceae bacterium]|nr:hypothetical protein [Comamonadaceae bacterium]